MGGVQPWLMARWKARVEFLLSVIGLLFLALTVEALQGKTYQYSLLSGGVGHLEPRFQEEGVVPEEYFMGSTKLETFCYRFDKIPSCDGRTDRQTDRRNCYS